MFKINIYPKLRVSHLINNLFQNFLQIDIVYFFSLFPASTNQRYIKRELQNYEIFILKKKW